MEAPLDSGQVALIALVVATVVALVIPIYVRRPGRVLRKRFVSLGTLKGKRRKEIIKVAGEPSIVTTLPGGRELLQWRATGYHIALVFAKNGTCDGVTHENGRRVVGR